MPICPYCTYKWNARRNAAHSARKLTKDLTKARADIDFCVRWLANPTHSVPEYRATVQTELKRLTRALTDHQLLAHIYRRNANGPK